MRPDRSVMFEPRALDAALKSKTQIWFWSGRDSKQNLFKKLASEWSDEPLQNPRLKEDLSGLLDKSNRIVLVYITSFFDEGTDFLYFVKGYRNLANFLKLTFSGKAYDDPCFAAPLRFHNFKDLIGTPGLESVQCESVGKTETKGLRWKYLYKSALNAWAKLEYDEEKDQAIRTRLLLARPPVIELSDTDEDSGSDMSDDTDEEDGDMYERDGTQGT